MITIRNRFTNEVILERETLVCANLQRANLYGANLQRADLYGADLRGAYLQRAYLEGADLYGADLYGAYLYGAYLEGADLRGADLQRANLEGANLEGADLRGATMPDGRLWEAYRADHLAGLCTTPEIRAKAIDAWGAHSWQDCPMHAAFNVEAPTSVAMAAWVALYDAKLLERPA